MQKKYCVISHTHWDREWYRPFENFRMRLCDLINNLFDIIEQYPDYIFHLDAQTVVLEDYLEIFPENREKLQKYIKNGNILVGPWYLQNDFFLTSGEATVRNLLKGTRLAKSFGRCADAGYAPDQFGNISQLPQILRGFGVDNFIFGRGFNPYAVNEKGEKYLRPIPSEFIWRGADGSEVLAVHMRYWYNNAQRFSADIDKAQELVKAVEDSFEGVTASPYILLMNGVDHLEAQEDLLPILDELNKREINGEIKQISLSDYINSVKGYVEQNGVKLEEFAGELRHGGDGSLLQGTLSSRHYLKVQNVLTQNLLENRIEPIYSMLHAAGFKGIYPQNYLHYMWKTLLQNHPHDSICGCSRDEVHSHMEDRYARVNEVGSELLTAALDIAAYHNGVAVDNKDAYSVVVANTTGNTVSGVAQVLLSFHGDENVNNFTITDAFGRNVEFVAVEKFREKRDIFSAINLPGSIMVDTYRLYIPIKDMLPFSFRGFKAVKAEGKLTVTENTPCADARLENENLIVEVSQEGRVDITCKQSGRKLEDCLYLEDTADKGDAYVFGSAGDTPISSKRFKSTVKMLENNPLVSRCSISFDMKLPERYDFEKDARSRKTANVSCELILTLEAFSKRVNIEYKIDNKASDHRLRMFVKTDTAADSFIADIPFDIINRRDDDINPMMVDNSHPNTSFAAIESDIGAVAVFTEGAHECSKIGKDTLAFTLVRATGVITKGSGKQWQCPENQCIRRLSGRMAIFLYDSFEGTSLSNASVEFRNPLIAHAMPSDNKKFTGGRPAVQGTLVSEIFYREDKNADARMPQETVLCCSNKAVVVTAFKLAEDGGGLIVRLFNSSASGLETTVKINGDIYECNLNEEISQKLGVNEITINMGGKQLVTLYIKK